MGARIREGIVGLVQRESTERSSASRIAPVIPEEHRRFPLLDPMRALAAISILGVHAALFAGTLEGDRFYEGIFAHLDIGVPIFFVLSAFLLYRPFVEARVLGRDRSSFARYGVRRFVRIAPAYWLALTVAAIVPGIAGAFSGNWWVYYGLLQNYPIFTPGADCLAANPFGCGLSTTWSLAVEVFFYALLPFFVIGMAWLARRWRGRNWLVPELIAVGALSAVSFVIQTRVPTSDLGIWLFFSPLGRGWWFGLGLGLAALSVWVQQRQREPAPVRWIRTRPTVPVAVALAIFLLSCLVILRPGPSLAFPVVAIPEYFYEYVAFGLIAALVLAPAMFGVSERSLYSRLLAHPSIAWLGLVSYGIFLWQMPVLLALDDLGVNDLLPRFQLPLTFGLAFAATVAIAAVSYYALERPLMRIAHRWARRTPAPPDVPPVALSDQSVQADFTTVAPGERVEPLRP
jgi:peptidoglycan/LPS O-acetylase OafA/YrhL